MCEYKILLRDCENCDLKPNTCFKQLGQCMDNRQIVPPGYSIFIHSYTMKNNNVGTIQGNLSHCHT